MKHFLLSLCIYLIVSVSASASVTGKFTAEDTSIRIYSSSSSTQNESKYMNYGCSKTLAMGAYQAYPGGGEWAGGTAVSLMRFEVSSLKGKHIEGTARLYLSMRIPWPDWPHYYQYMWTPGVRSVPLADADWVAGSSNGAIEFGASCFAQKQYGSANWSGSFFEAIPEIWGGLDPNQWILPTYTGREYRYTDSWSGQTEVYRLMRFDIPAEIVSAWANSPSTNSGLMIFGEERFALSGAINNIASSESEHWELRPFLNVTYSSVPEPSALVCLSATLCSLAIPYIRRRKRS